MAAPISFLNAYRPDSFQPAVDHAQRAISLDPSFANAWLALSFIYANGSGMVPERAAEWSRRAPEALERARALAPDSVGPQWISAIFLVGNGRWLEAGALVDKLRKKGTPPGETWFNPTMAEGRILLAAGRAKDAIEVYNAPALQSRLIRAWLCISASRTPSRDETADARAEFNRGLKIGRLQPLLLGSGLLLALSERDRGEIDKRVALFDENKLLDEGSRAMAKLLDTPAAAPAEIRRLATLPRNQVFIGYSVLASWAAYCNQPELALDYLNKIVRSSPDPSLLWRPQMRDVRKLPGFKDLLRNTGYVGLAHLRMVRSLSPDHRRRLRMPVGG